MNAERSIQTDGAGRKLAPGEWLDVPLTNTSEGRERLAREREGTDLALVWGVNDDFEAYSIIAFATKDAAVAHAATRRAEEQE